MPLESGQHKKVGKGENRQLSVAPNLKVATDQMIVTGQNRYTGKYSKLAHEFINIS